MNEPKAEDSKEVVLLAGSCSYIRLYLIQSPVRDK
jgi:hypothetical protein